MFQKMAGNGRMTLYYIRTKKVMFVALLFPCDHHDEPWSASAGPDPNPAGIHSISLSAIATTSWQQTRLLGRITDSNDSSLDDGIGSNSTTRQRRLG
jgi:hypothetical protein